MSRQALVSLYCMYVIMDLLSSASGLLAGASSVTMCPADTAIHKHYEAGAAMTESILLGRLGYASQLSGDE